MGIIHKCFTKAAMAACASLLAAASFPLAASAQQSAGIPVQAAFTPDIQIADGTAALHPQKNSHTVTYSSAGDAFADFLIEVLTGIWFLNNATVSFEPYPYAAQGKYLVFADFGASANFTDSYVDADGDGGESTAVSTRVFRFAADSSMFLLKGYGIGNESRIEGYLFKFVGPLVENVLYSKDSKAIGQNGNDAGNLRVGGELALVQTNMISLSLFVQWDHWYGSLSADGVAFGGIVRSYPAKPLLLEWRGIAHDIYRNGEELWAWESILEVGFMAWRNIEVFAAWRHVDTAECPYFFTTDRTDGISAGFRIHF